MCTKATSVTYYIECGLKDWQLYCCMCVCAGFLPAPSGSYQDYGWPFWASNLQKHRRIFLYRIHFQFQTATGINSCSLFHLKFCFLKTVIPHSICSWLAPLQFRYYMVCRISVLMYYIDYEWKGKPTVPQSNSCVPPPQQNVESL